MDRERFDELARLFATKGSRRSALGALFSVALLGHDPDDAEARKGKKGRKDRGKNDKNRDRNKNRNRNQQNDQDNTGDDAEREQPVEVAADEAAAPETGTPEVQAEAASGRKRKRKAKGRGRGKDKGRNRKQAESRATQTQAEARRCCGTRSCSKPTSGSNSYECNFAGDDLSGRRMTGVNFGKIDGRETNFDNANVRGANFGEACLQNATFRGTDVSSTNFHKACLFFADFTGARNLNVSVSFSGALLCGTILPDGTVSDRDCDRATACCAACDAEHPCEGGQRCCNGRCVDGDCCGTGDCEPEQCQNVVCDSFQCEYTPVIDGSGPLCANRCCNGVCCTVGQVCDNNDNCCTRTPQNQACEGKCGNVSDGCGGTYNCGACPVLTCQNGSCTGPNNTCAYTPVEGTSGPNCENSICCKNQAGQPVCCAPGTTQCDANGQCCVPRECPANACGTISDGCGGTIDCPDCTGGLVCVENTCQACTSTDQCNENEVCCAGTCQAGNCCPTAGPDEGIAETCTVNQNCCARGCIGINNLNNCGTCGNRCENSICCTRTCTNGQCGCTPVDNGQPGPLCQSPGFCCGGDECCTEGQVCDTSGAEDVCCTPVSICPADACGNVPDGCGSTINCGPCDERICQDATCNAQNACDYVDSANNQPGPLCSDPSFCCGGNCCTQNQVCDERGVEDVCCTRDTFNETCDVGTAAPKCGNVTDNCGVTVNCGPCAEVLCQNGTCTGPDNTCAYTPVTDGQPGTLCSAPGFCCDGDECCDQGDVCLADGCCTPETFDETCDVGTANPKCSNVTNNCGQTIDCGLCAVQTCKTGTCGSVTPNICTYVNQTSGQSGNNCLSPLVCCEGVCCTEGQVCDTRPTPDICCTPDSTADTCAGKCGDVTNNCGQTVNCPACPAQTCRTVVCNPNTDTCDYTIQPDGQSGTNCTNQCCNGNCCPSGNVCNSTTGQCEGTCGGQVCGPTQTCCGNRCEEGICCEILEGCNPGTCCDGLTCIPVSPPQPNLPPSICQRCCQSGPDCPDDMNCVGEPAFCGTNICSNNKCCRPRSCNTGNQCISDICCGGVCCIGDDICGPGNVCVSP